MDNKKLNEQESLELITQMIQNTKFKMVKNAGTPFLVWGYMTVVTSLLVWYLLKETGNYYWQFLWLLMPAVSYPVTIYSQRKKQRMARTYIDRIVVYVWVVFGLCGLLISCVSMIYWSLPILFVILLMMGMGTTLTGLIINMKLVTVSGVLGIFASLGCLYIDKFDQILLFALAFVFMMVIPGHYLNIMSKRRF